METQRLSAADARAAAHAVAETMRRLEAGKLHRGGLRADLYYSINPWSSEACDVFLAQVVAAYEELGPMTGEWHV